MYASVNSCERNINYPLSVSEPCPVTVVDNDVVPPAVVRIMDLALGREHSLALSAQNELWAWGSGCQLGLVTSSFPVWRPQKVSLCKAQMKFSIYNSAKFQQISWKAIFPVLW